MSEKDGRSFAKGIASEEFLDLLLVYDVSIRTILGRKKERKERKKEGKKFRPRLRSLWK
jgi:hypothetical protein